MRGLHRDGSRILLFFITGALFLFAFSVGCRNVLLTAPTGSVLQITVNPDWVPANGGTAAVMVEGYRPNGAPLPDGTVINFYANLGRVVPNQVETHDGRAQVTFISDHRSGTVTIRAFSGPENQAEAELRVGTSAVGVLEMGAFPAVLPFGGGTTRIVVRALTEGGSPVPNVAIFLTSDAGRLQSNGKFLLTDADGRVEDRLTTEQQTVVTASAGSLTATVTVAVGEQNEYPVPSFEFSPTLPVVGEDVFFNAFASFDPDGTIVKYEWDFGDGGRATGVKARHAYTASGSYVVVLKVTDDDGFFAATSRSVNVSAFAGQPPFAIFNIKESTADGVYRVNENLTFDASGSFDPDGGAILQYQFDFGDGSVVVSGSPTVNHAYTAEGTYTVTLTVTDDDFQTDVYSLTISVAP